MKIVSACLAGINCKYTGGNNRCQKVVDLVANGKAIPVCPEQLGGLTTPREPVESDGDKVVTKEGMDATIQFKKGAKEGLRIAKMVGCKKAILKAKSPSCGCGKIYDGTFTDTLIEGDGVFTKILKENGIEVTAMDKDPSTLP
jgi:uncharacterized protein YbbK (DUF523 family)